MADYSYWEQALENPAALKNRELRITTEPQFGFYRTRDGKAVAIWMEDGGIVLTVDGFEAPPERHADIWVGCAMRPIPETWHEGRLEGRPWPDIDEGLAEMGDNVRQGMDEVEQIAELAASVKNYGQIEDDQTAAKAISLRARLMELKGVVDKKREALKAPHLKQCRDIDEAWMGPVKQATGAANVLKALVDAWETLKRRKQREADEALERVRRAAAAQHQPLPEPAPAATPAPKAQIKAGYGRAAAVRERLRVIEITDWATALDSVGHRDSIIQAMLKEAQKVIDAGAETVPGFAVELRAEVR